MLAECLGRETIIERKTRRANYMVVAVNIGDVLMLTTYRKPCRDPPYSRPEVPAAVPVYLVPRAIDAGGNGKPGR